LNLPPIRRSAIFVPEQLNRRPIEGETPYRTPADLRASFRKIKEYFILSHEEWRKAGEARRRQDLSSLGEACKADRRAHRGLRPPLKHASCLHPDCAPRRAPTQTLSRHHWGIRAGPGTDARFEEKYH